jgi:hypothetical protein
MTWKCGFGRLWYVMWFHGRDISLGMRVHRSLVLDVGWTFNIWLAIPVLQSSRTGLRGFGRFFRARYGF